MKRETVSFDTVVNIFHNQVIYEHHCEFRLKLLLSTYHRPLKFVTFDITKFPLNTAYNSLTLSLSSYHHRLLEFLLVFYQKRNVMLNHRWSPLVPLHWNMAAVPMNSSCHCCNYCNYLEHYRDVRNYSCYFCCCFDCFCSLCELDVVYETTVVCCKRTVWSCVACSRKCL